MNNLTISIFENQIFLKIINELKLFSEFKVKFYDDFNSCLKDSIQHEQLTILFVDKKNNDNYLKIKNSPIILIGKSFKKKDLTTNNLIEYLDIPFSVLELKKKIILLNARYKFKKSSLINLGKYIIDKNERKIKKEDLELQLTEKEINFLILFSQNKQPVSRNYVLKNVWNYSPETDTHTIETHIHRLRKKISNKFKDNNFIKNNKKGYYI